MENEIYYRKVVDLCFEKRWFATWTAITEEGRPDDGTDWKQMFEEWSLEKV